MSKIFLSYRRDDSAATCGRIYKDLAAHFGRDAIFKDVDDIPYGVRFPDYLAEHLRACRVELVVIGRFWLTLTTPDGTRRLDAPGDFVRTEVEMGLRDGLIVVPVLVDNASMPHAEDLPASIRELVELQGAEIHYDPYFDVDMQRLIRQLERWLGSAAPAGAPPSITPIVTLPATPVGPEANLIAQMLPGIREAAARQDWHLAIEKAEYLTGELPAAAVPVEVWRLLGDARSALGDFPAASNAFAHNRTDPQSLRLAAQACLCERPRHGSHASARRPRPHRRSSGPLATPTRLCQRAQRTSAMGRAAASRQGGRAIGP